MPGDPYHAPAHLTVGVTNVIVLCRGQLEELGRGTVQLEEHGIEHSFNLKCAK